MRKIAPPKSTLVENKFSEPINQSTPILRRKLIAKLPVTDSNQNMGKYKNNIFKEYDPILNFLFLQSFKPHFVK